MPKQGAIMLIPVPFTDLSSTKRRPVIVISNDDYHQITTDMVVVAMTSNPTVSLYSFTITTSDLSQGSLNRPGTVRVDKIYTLDQSLTVKNFGQVNEHTLDRIRALIRDLITQRPSKSKNTN